MAKDIKLDDKDGALIFRAGKGIKVYFPVPESNNNKPASDLVVAISKLMFGIHNKEVIKFLDKKWDEMITKINEDKKWDEIVARVNEQEKE